MLSARLTDLVRHRLQGIEAGFQVEVLYAAETGSRAWGFPSPDSDYDIRFIYRHHRDWYLSLREERDAIEYPLDHDGLDLIGWDLRKALRLFLKSSPPLWEILVSPYAYVQVGGFQARLAAMARRLYSPRGVAWHYFSTADRHWRAAVQGRSLIQLKQYLYCLRPLLALQWMREKGELPPVSMPDLLAGLMIPAEMVEAAESLIRKKNAGSELETGDHIPIVDAWIESQMEPGRAFAQTAAVGAPAMEEIDHFFREILGGGTPG